MRLYIALSFALVSSMIVSAATLGWGFLACQPSAQVRQAAQPTIQISWMQSSARPRWGGGQ
ncbi:MAG: hypothetical protein KME07_19165 [Pegethrix bostrychoides GSE-TBD4-15B]|uniref:Uncharacterized protein n=1 Tax=Pegethrix bostrychoides GSE-TBD4-15B TaxID=2839662 RepID=A0A951U7J4_9CYAN|nr:hypothetical protein [Pegethrix bostrychoides GSE-TBD4-15B]